MSKYIDLFVSYPTDSEIFLDKLDINDNQRNVALAATRGIPCLKKAPNLKIDEGQYGTQPDLKRLFSPSDGCDRGLCSNCRLVCSRAGGCADLLNADSKTANPIVEFRDLPRRGDVDGRLLDLSGKV